MQITKIIQNNCLAWVVCLLTSCLGAISALAQEDNQQIAPPDRKHLFREDTKDSKRGESKLRSSVLQPDAASSDDLNLKADNTEYLKESKQFKGSGNVVLSRDGLQAQADQALVNTETKEAQLSGNVLITHSGGVISADSGELNLDTETGKFKQSEFTIEQDAYNVWAKETEKISETKYKLADCGFSTCHCQDESKPWSINSSTASITQEGYAHTFGTNFSLYDVPLMYSPYFGFPVKQERQSGLLVPTFGYSSEDGLALELPYFIVLDDQTDFTLSPFTQMQTRTGTGLDFRRSFSRNSYAAGRLIYSDEGARGDDLRGTNIDGIFDPTFDEQRFGGFFKQIWKNSAQSDLPLSMITDVHYISDDLFLREMEDEDIGLPDSRYATSTALLRGVFDESILAELSGEYNQSIYSDDDLTFQHLPELSVIASRSDHPFGTNPYGLKLVSGANLTATEFSRSTGYDGLRTDIYPNIKIPFHYQNYFSSEMALGLRHTEYKLDDTSQPGSSAQLDDSADRNIMNFTYTMSTALERVYSLPEDNFLTFLTSLGSENQDTKLKRVKHTIEPIFKYTYIPDTTQDELPFFDSVDRIREKSLFVYGFRTGLLGRFLPTKKSTEAISELSPEIRDLPSAFSGLALPDIGESTSVFGGDSGFGLREGEVHELAYLSFKQAYDYKEDTEDNDPLRSAWSDLSTNIGVSPSRSFAFQLETNYDAADRDLSSWGLSSHFFDDRGDALRARVSYIENSLSQIDGNLELALTGRLKFGIYSRYDEKESEFIENRMALRLASQCDCWFLDLGLSDRINPDREQVFLTFTLAGLGDITQKFSTGNRGS